MIRNLLQALSVPKVITVFCLLALGANGMVQVGIQHDMSVKASKLQASLQQSEQLSLQMKNGVSGLNNLRDTTTHMSATLQQLQSSTADMNQGLATLEQIVSGINSAVQNLNQSSKDSDGKISSTIQTSQQLSSLLQQLNQVNTDVVTNLSAIVHDQNGINANLEDMNRKTQLLPRLGGK
jgi:DNA repair ATPase RecN